MVNCDIENGTVTIKDELFTDVSIIVCDNIVTGMKLSIVLTDENMNPIYDRTGQLTIKQKLHIDVESKVISSEEWFNANN